MTKPNKKVVCAVILQNQKILLAQRNSKSDLENKWEFPGGKIGLNETEEEALHREIREELNIEITILNRLKMVTHIYPEFSIDLIPFLCSTEQLPELLVHKAIYWAEIYEIGKFDLADADVLINIEIQQIFN